MKGKRLGRPRVDAWTNKKPFKANEVGILYMLAGDVGSSNTDPYAEAPTSSPDRAMSW